MNILDFVLSGEEILGFCRFRGWKACSRFGRKLLDFLVWDKVFEG